VRTVFENVVKLLHDEGKKLEEKELHALAKVKDDASDKESYTVIDKI
jgi:hypothetical protein